MSRKGMAEKGAVILVWLAVWQVLTKLVGNEILLAGPWEVLCAIISNMQETVFWKTVLYSMLRILTGFFSGLLVGIFLAVLSAKNHLVQELLKPVIALLKAVPVASFVVLFLIWWRADGLSVAVSFMVVLPHIYTSMLSGIRAADKKLTEMAKVFHMPHRNQIYYLYRPACRPFLDSAIKISIGMSWKSGVAAEVIGMPDASIGEALYMAKIYLETADVLAWTVVTIALSAICEKIIIYLWNLFCNWHPCCKINTVASTKKQKQNPAVSFADVTKKYGACEVLKGYSGTYDFKKTYFFRSPSGSGKTTMFRLISGLEKPDEGKIEISAENIGYLFQEDRLCEDYSALINVAMVSSNPQKSKAMLCELLPQEVLDRPCRELSGGMKRRVALVRAFSTDADILLLDEPYTGLDVENAEKVKTFIQKYQQNSCVLLATHLPL